MFEDDIESAVQTTASTTLPSIRPPTMGLASLHKAATKVKKPTVPKPPQVQRTSPATQKSATAVRRKSTSALPQTEPPSPRAPALQIVPMNLEDFKIPRKPAVKLIKAQKLKAQVEKLPPPGQKVRSKNVSLPMQQPKPTALFSPMNQETAISPPPPVNSNASTFPNVPVIWSMGPSPPRTTTSTTSTTPAYRAPIASVNPRLPTHPLPPTVRRLRPPPFLPARCQPPCQPCRTSMPNAKRPSSRWQLQHVLRELSQRSFPLLT